MDRPGSTRVRRYAAREVKPGLKGHLSFYRRKRVSRPPFGNQMSLLIHTSVRSILAGVFLVLAVVLCASLGWQLYGASDLSTTAQRVSRLATADKAVFKST